MTNLITIIIFATLLGGAFLIERANSNSKDVPMATIQTCIDLELSQCGDKLCEMSYESNYPVVKQAFENLLDCIKGAK